MLVGLEGLDGPEDLLGIEPAEEARPRAEDVARVHHREAVGMRQRQDGDAPVRPVELVERGRRARIGLEVVMRERHALGHPGGPRRVEDHREVVGAALLGRKRLGLPRDLPGERPGAAIPPAVHEQHVAKRGQDADLRVDLPEHIARGDDDLRLGVGEDVRDLRVAEQEDHRDDHAARPQNSAVALQHLGTVGQHDHDAVARLDPEAAQRIGHAARRPMLLDIGVLPPLEGERDVFAVLLEALLHQARE